MSDCYVTEQLCAARRNTDDERFARDKSRLGKVEQRLDDMEKLMHEVSQCNAKLTLMVENLNKSSDDHEDRISEIEKKPGTYWEKVVLAIITAAAGIVAGLMFGGVMG